MKCLATIDCITRPALGGEAFAQLCSVFPEGQWGTDGGGFRAVLDRTDSRVDALLEILASFGRVPWANPKCAFNPRCHFMLRYERRYEAVDLHAFDYFEVRPRAADFIRGRSRYTMHDVGAIDEPGRGHVAATWPPLNALLTSEARRALEDQGLRGIEYLPVGRTYDALDYDRYGRAHQWWHLVAKESLGPVDDVVVLLTRDHQPFRGDFSEGCCRSEGLHKFPELQYPRGALASLEHHDLSWTHERFGGRPTEFDRALVASRRFFDTCRAHDIHFDWRPVHVREDD